MISFAYTPVGSTAVTTVQLLDSDRFWPASIDISAHGEAQTSAPVRNLTKVFYGRGLKHFELRLPTTRQHANLMAALQYALQTVPAIAGALGTLTIIMPGNQGTLRARNCVCTAASGRNIGVRSYCDFVFVGPSIGP